MSNLCTFYTLVTSLVMCVSGHSIGTSTLLCYYASEGPGLIGQSLSWPLRLMGRETGTVKTGSITQGLASPLVKAPPVRPFCYVSVDTEV